MGRAGVEHGGEGAKCGVGLVVSERPHGQMPSMLVGVVADAFLVVEPERASSPGAFAWRLVLAGQGQAPAEVIEACEAEQ